VGDNESRLRSTAVGNYGAFHYARPIGQKPVDLTKGKWNYIVRKKQNWSKFPFTFRPKFRSLPIEVRLETRIFDNGTASFGRAGPTGQRAPPLEVDHFFRKIATGPKRSIYVSTEISGNFGIMANTLLCCNKYKKITTQKKHVCIHTTK